MFTALGAGAALKVFSNLVARQGENANFGGLASEVDNVRGNTDRTNDEFIGHPDLLPEHVWVSKTEFRQHILENLIPLKDGLTPDQLYDLVVSKPKGSRPNDPSVYLQAEYIANHFKKFDGGAVRVYSKASYEKYGTIGPTDGFAMSKADFDQMIVDAAGDLRVLETKLGLKKYALNSGDIAIAVIRKENLPYLKIATGNEGGANEFWLPGGVTSGGVAEIVTSFPKTITFENYPIN